MPPAAPRTLRDHFGLVWITGAGKGIGRALALHLLAQGVDVAGSARTKADLDSLTKEAQGLPGSLSVHPLDIINDKAVARTLTEIERKRGPVRTAVLNAGTHKPIGLKDFSTAALRGLVEVNLMGTVHCLDALLASMRDRAPDARGERGRIAVVGSVAGYRGLPTSAGYGATKAGLANMMESLKPEADALGIRLQLIAPGFVRTPLTDLNDFPMPFLMEPEAAARKIARGLTRNRFEIAFPRGLVWPLKIARMLPEALYFPLIGQMTGAGREDKSKESKESKAPFPSARRAMPGRGKRIAGEEG